VQGQSRIRSEARVVRATTWEQRGLSGASCAVQARLGQFFCFVFCLLWFSTVASAQISPGPLSRAHQSLNGTTNCTTCHKFGGQATLKCLDCHTEVASRLTVRKGLHATYGIAAGSSQECAKCHSEHNGEEFPLVKWDIKAFDHKQAARAQ
jgi:hypothetical protein